MKLFVYGSLKKGKSANDLLTAATFVGPGCLHGYGLYGVSSWPGIKLNKDDKTHPCVFGEIYEIDEDILSQCDMYEGYPGLFNRVEVEVVMGDLDMSVDVCTCWVYTYNGEVSKDSLIESGVWDDG